MNVVLISTYELGHQSFGMASARAWLARDGHQVHCVDLAVERFSDAPVREADLVAFSLPMHTATRLALPVIERVKRVNPSARIACYGLYAPLNAELLKSLGVEAILGGEFEHALVAWACKWNPDSNGGDVPKLAFLKPDRSGLGASYAKLQTASGSKTVA